LKLRAPLAVIAILSSAASIPACGSSDSGNSNVPAAGSGGAADSGKQPGTEGGPCYGNGTCNTGLACLSSLCVNAGTGGSGGSDASVGGSGGSAGAGGAAGSAGSGGDAEAGPADSGEISDGSDGQEPDGGTEAGAESGLGCDAGALDLAGLWAVLVRYELTLTGKSGGALTTCPSPQAASSELLMLLDVVHNNTTVDVTPVPCWITLPSYAVLIGACDPQAPNLVTVSLTPSQQLLAALPSVIMPSAHGALSGATPGSSLTMVDPFSLLLGSTEPPPAMPAWHSANAGCGLWATNIGRGPACEAACVDDCPATLDHDGDSYLGISIDVCGRTPDDVQNNVSCQLQEPSAPGTTVQGMLRAALFTNPKLHGSIKSSCEITGKLDAALALNLLGADVYLANTMISVASMALSLPDQQPDSAKSSFRMLRVDGKHGSVGWNLDASQKSQACATILQHKSELQ
jgi:hypothetical protein